MNGLLVPDLAADMLDWIDGAFTATDDPGRFTAFANTAAKQLQFDPRKLQPQDAVRRLAMREGGWAEVWTRFEGSTGFETIVTYLDVEEPPSLLGYSDTRDSYPRLNAQDEDHLRDALIGLSDVSPIDAKERIAELDGGARLAS